MASNPPYFDEKDVGDEVYDGEEVPGPNTITEERYDRYKDRCFNEINGFLKLPIGTFAADTFGTLKGIGLDLFKQLVDKEDFGLTTMMKRKIVANRYAGVPVENF